MSLKTLIVTNKTLYDILNEIGNIINLKIVNGADKDLNFGEFDNYLLISLGKKLNKKNELFFSDYPIKIKKLIEIININFLKINYNLKSKINVGKYELNLNSRILKLKNNSLDLTEMEANVIIFLKNSDKPTNIKILQEKVWGHVPDLETHTVETHIYRLRKKIKEKFNDEYFINSTKNGYEIK